MFFFFVFACFVLIQSIRNRSQTMPPAMSSSLRHHSINDSLPASSKTANATNQKSIFQFPPVTANTNNSSVAPESSHPPPLHPKRTSEGYLRSVLDPHRAENYSSSCHKPSACSDHVPSSGSQLVRQVAHVHPSLDGRTSASRHVPPLCRKSNSLAESDLRRNREVPDPSGIRSFFYLHVFCFLFCSKSLFSVKFMSMFFF